MGSVYCCHFGRGWLQNVRPGDILSGRHGAKDLENSEILRHTEKEMKQFAPQMSEQPVYLCLSETTVLSKTLDQYVRIKEYFI